MTLVTESKKHARHHFLVRAQSKIFRSPCPRASMNYKNTKKDAIGCISPVGFITPLAGYTSSFRQIAGVTHAAPSASRPYSPISKLCLVQDGKTTKKDARGDISTTVGGTMIKHAGGGVGRGKSRASEGGAGEVVAGGGRVRRRLGAGLRTVEGAEYVG